MKKIVDFNGIWQAEAEGLGKFTVSLPGTLDTNEIGHADVPRLATRLTRLHTYEGKVTYFRDMVIPERPGKRLFLKMERTREVTLRIDGQEQQAYICGTLSTPYLFEITEFAGKKVCMQITVDNQYTKWPRESVIGASAVTDETQTNWNGILGEFGIYETTPVFFRSLRVYPFGNPASHVLRAGGQSSLSGKGYPSRYTAEVCAELDGISREEVGEILELRLLCEAFAEEAAGEISYVYEEAKRLLKITIFGILLRSDCRYWDEKEGNLYTLSAQWCGRGDAEKGVHLQDGKKKERMLIWEAGSGEWCTGQSVQRMKQRQQPGADIQRTEQRQQPGADIHQTGQILAEEQVEFGVRTFGVDDQLRLTLNGRRIFLRGEANCCVFPETGHPPLTREEWEDVLGRYAAYGVNCMRFHSWCPPDAAFQAADHMGMLMQPELSQWNFKDAFGTPEAREYYHEEMCAILQSLANHPSFVMLTFGNELQNAPEGESFVAELLKEAKVYDATRLYANASNYHYGEVGTDPNSDFYTAMAIREEMLRATSSPMIGHLNHTYPSADTRYDHAVEKVLGDGKSCFGFEVGQYEVLPDFREIEQFHGVTKPQNLVQIKENVEKAGMLSDWDRYVEATGELALLCYREEVEAVLRTGGMSGLSLLGLQDFPGQGTALVGMMNSHLEPKPYAFAKPERFSAFFREVLPMLYLQKYTYESQEELCAEMVLANYGKGEVCGTAGWEVYEKEQAVSVTAPQKVEGAAYTGYRKLCGGIFPEAAYTNGGVLSVGRVHLSLPESGTARRLYIRIFVGNHENQYPIWVYPQRECLQPDGKTAIRKLSEELLSEIAEGAQVFLEPEPTKENLPYSIGGQFTTDFWSVGTFPVQEGGMGMVIDEEHPVFREFPTEFHSEYQWWAMAQGRPMVLPGQIRPMVTVPDSYSRLKHMGLLFEAGFGKGKIMVSSMGLFDKQQYPECRSLLHSLLGYMKQKGNTPKSSISREELERLVPWNKEPDERRSGN